MIDISLTFSQDFKFGTPKIYNHSKEAYNAGPQNWSAAYRDGVVFFANNGGLLSFDGITWRTFPTPGNTIMRSIALSKNDKIYVGAQNEIGYFTNNKIGTLGFTDLKKQFEPQVKGLSEIWHIIVEGETLIFSSDKTIYLQRKNNLLTFSKASNINTLSKVSGTYWYHSDNNPIYQIENDHQKPIPGSEIFQNKRIIKIIQDTLNERVFVLTQKNGIYLYKNGLFEPWVNNAQEFLKSKRISSADYHPKHGLFVGTYLGGLVIIDDDGKTRVALNKKNGLQNNTINALTYTPNGILWLGTNNGIDEIDLSSLSRKFFPDNELEGAVYDFDSWKDKYYFSTSNGLYTIDKKDYYNPLDDLNFKLVPGTEGQTWGTDIINDQLYCAHHEGPMKISLKAQPIGGANSAWKFIALSEDVLALGSYQGISLYKIKENKDLEFYRKVENFEESARIMVVDKFKNLWVSHPYKNVYRVNFNDDFSSETLKIFSKEDGFVDNNRNYVFDINQICYLTNESGIYKYNQAIEKFERDKTLNIYFEAGDHVRRLIQIDNNIWCISDRNTTCLTLKKNGIDNEIQKSTLQNLNTVATYIGGFEELFPLEQTSLIISTEDGAIEYDLEASKLDQLDVEIKSIVLPLQLDSLVYSAFQKSKEIDLGPQANAVRISYRTNYPNTNNYHEYSYRLLDNDTDWSPWTSNTTKEYNNLSSGQHQFELKGRTVSLLESPISKITINIEAPWYKKTVAKLIYFLLLIFLVAALLLIPRRKYQETTAQLEEEKRKTEEDLEAIRKEKLVNEIRFKNQELASNTLQLLQKNQTLNTLREKFDDLNDSVKNPAVRKELNNIIKIFRNDMRLDEDWDKFSLHFDQVHHDFIRNLKTKYPNLSTNDHKLCAYLKMNLSTKEIAPLLNISVRGVEISRYRLRKKLQLERSVNLNEFFNSDW